MENTTRKLVWGSLQKNIVMDDDMMIGKRTGEVDFIIFIGHNSHMQQDGVSS